MTVESILLTAVQVSSFYIDQLLAGATGFYFQRGNRLFLITNRHMLIDEAAGHFPDRIELTLHVNRENIAETRQFSMLLHDNKGAPNWIEASDGGGLVDVVAIPIQRDALTEDCVFETFTEHHLVSELEQIEVGESVRIVGFPLGFKDNMHSLPVMRQAIIASSFSLRFQGQGYFLTDSLLHRGSSGSPVVYRLRSSSSGRESLPWLLLGVHSARLDSENRDAEVDERLNLFCAWYADVLLTLTADNPATGENIT
ncbi:MAG: trypsin-like peptidase domain-containing protein [Gammaproteobacteria bacterium]|nr:trypsin-like peptidase domain-containing protein [Gammaproteobacteria bacterium]